MNEEVVEWLPRVRYRIGDGPIQTWTGKPSEDEQWARGLADHIATKVPGGTGSVMRRSVSRTPWVEADEPVSQPDE